MIRRAATALAGTAVLAASAGCAHQESFDLPDLTPRDTTPGVQVYPSYGYGYGSGYPLGYQPGYGNVYGYANPYYVAQGPYPYGDGYGYVYNPYPRYVVVPCADSNRDGHCDRQPPKQRHDRDPRGHDNDDPPSQPDRSNRGDVPGVRNGDGRNVAPNAQRRAVPVSAPVLQQPARVQPEPRRVTPSAAADQRGPRAGSGRAATTGTDVVSSPPTQEP
jgi:hypothetical protein